jgi:predicted nuclease of predicted toxin-antitoxin system
MKLLFDHHLSRKLVTRVADIFPSSSHVVFHGLEEADGIDIWLFARANGYTIVTKDSDFNDITGLRKAPPKVIWLHVGNCSNQALEDILRKNSSRIIDFINDPASEIMEIR